MNPLAWLQPGSDCHAAKALVKDGERMVYRVWRRQLDGTSQPSIAVVPAIDSAASSSSRALSNEFALKDDLEDAWALRPVDLLRESGRIILMLEDQGGHPLERLLDGPMELGRFLRVSCSLAAALGHLHERGLVHKNIKPANVFVNAGGGVRLTGFGIASRLPKERQSPDPPERIAGTLAYMAPEQTGRMNRSIDSRSDLYAVGITLYQMLTGVLPFTASEPMEWVHCHIARRPMPPSEWVNVPAAVSAIIMKLLAKTAEERYQTAAGLEHDLRCCLSLLESEGRIDNFALGKRDTPDRLLISEKLYGREREVETLLTAFDRVAQGGAPELVLVSGYSGIGKSAVVNELQKVLVPSRGLFAAGKFDQYKRDIPYSTLSQALQDLVRSLLTRSDAELGEWRVVLREALGSNGQLMVDLIPELALIIGDQGPVPELPPQDSSRRFQLAFGCFLGVFAQPEHPLVLFLDDLQWIDSATLDLLEELLGRFDIRNLLVIGAYRDNDVTSVHPLMRRLEAIRGSARVRDISLAPLNADNVRDFVADSLRCEAECAGPLARLVHAKTDGNPFFVIQFLHVLADEGLLAFDYEKARWSWDLSGIHAKRYTDNVVELLAGKLTRLQRATQNALGQLACLGNVADVAMLSLVLGIPCEEVDAALEEAVRQQLVSRLGSSYSFAHDRVQEAAYALIPEASRAEVHLAIGRLLVACLPPEKHDEMIFEIVNQLNRGAPLIAVRDEREQLARLNLAAAKRAMASSAYASALTYLSSGAAVLPKDAWQRAQQLAFELELYPADCEICTGALKVALDRLAALEPHVSNAIQRCAVARRRVDLYTMFGAAGEAVTGALECLREVGIVLPPRPTEEEARSEYERIWSQLGSRTIEDVVDLPLMQDPESIAILDVLVRLSMPALYTDQNLYALSVCRAANLSLERGNNEVAPYSYAVVGLIACARFGQHDRGYRLARMACALVERQGWNHVGGRTYFFFAAVIAWTRPLGEKIAALRRAFAMAKHGDPAFAGFASRAITTALFASGHPLEQVERQAEEENEFVRKFGFFLAKASAPLAFFRTLRGKTSRFGPLDEEYSTGDSFEEGLESDRPAYAFLEAYYCIRTLRARFFAGDYASAVEAADKAERWHETCPTLALYLTETADLHFYAALSRAARCEPLGRDPYARHREALQRNARKLQGWAANCPSNYQDKAALVGAEIARLEGRELDAERLYEAAITSARQSGFVHEEALANELAARFYAARGFETISHAYLRHARHGYLRWGADGKVRQLDQLYPHLGAEHAGGLAGTIGTVVEQLDLATVIKVSQAVSGEMVLDKLLDTVMRTALEQAGAERAILILSREAGHRIVAESATTDNGISVQLRDEPVTASALPLAIFRYVLHTRESVCLDDAAVPNPFSTDPYIDQRHARSVLCLPLENQAKPIGVLYLENNLVARVFAPACTVVLKLIASQAAISLENSRLYRDLAAREARIRRLVDANIVGIFIWDLQGRVLDANEAFLRMLGYERQELVAGRLRWTDLTPPEWLDRDQARQVPKLQLSGSLQPYEKEYFRKDGSRVPVLIGAALFEDAADAGVAFVLDLTERKRAEAEARQSERRYRDMEMRLAEANRVAGIGQLSASIAHELNQPLAGIVTNANTCRRRLSATPPNVEGAAEVVQRLVRDANRASEVISHLRSLFVEKAAPVESIDMNEAAREVLALSSSALEHERVLLSCELAEDLPPVAGDRIQIQQVIMNFVRNAVDAMKNTDHVPRKMVLRTQCEEGGRVRLSVQDTGVGVNPGLVDKLFEAFYTTKTDGMGIGLSVSRSIIERHHGRIWAEPNADHGATFSFSIPCATPKSPPAGSEKEGAARER